MRVHSKNYLIRVHDQKSLGVWKKGKRFTFYRVVLEEQRLILLFIQNFYSDFNSCFHWSKTHV